MPWLRSQSPAGLRRARLLVAAWMLVGGMQAMAQTPAPPIPDPLAPKLSTDPRNPPRFQKSNRAPFAQAPASAVFTPPASGAGSTGFDSTNSRKVTRKARAKPKSSSGAAAAAPAPDQAIAPGTPQATAPSPYQKPAPAPASGSGAYASAPGAPPVELGPIRKPPPKRKAHSEPDDPYAPIGVQVGAFTLFPAVELIGGYDTNPSRGTNAQGAALYTVAPELRTQSNWSRHEFKSELRGSYTGYSPDTEPTLSRPNVDGKADGRIDVTRTTRIDLGGRLLVATDNPGSPNLQAGLAKLPIYETFGGNVGVGQRFNRFDLSLKGDVQRTAYQDSVLTNGLTASNESRNYNQYGVILRGGYELMPGVTPFVEVGADTRRHDLAIDPSGYQRDSKGTTGQVGTTFELSRLLTGEISGGYTQRNYEDARLNELTGFIGNASLIWTANALTTVKFTASSSIGESTIAGVSGIFYRDAGVQIDHSFRRWLIGSVKLGFGLDTYQGTNVGSTTSICGCVVSTPGGTAADRVDQRYSAGLGLTYKLSRSTQIKGEFRQEWLRSNVTGNDYTASIFLLGLRFQQ